MPDISKCPGDGCNKRNGCYRYTAKPSKYLQSYFVAPPLKDDGSCDYYWPDREDSGQNEAEAADREGSDEGG